MRKLRPAADRRRHDRAAARRAARARPDRDRPRRGRVARPRRRPARRRSVAGRHARRCRRPGLAQLRGGPQTRPARWSTSTAGRSRSSAPGRLLAPHAHAMMDVSDGLLLDARRMAEASGCAIAIELDALPLSERFRRRARAGSRRRGCSPRPAATITRCSPRCPPDSIRQRFLYQTGRRSARIGALAAGDPAISARQRRAADRTAGDAGF